MYVYIYIYVTFRLPANGDSSRAAFAIKTKEDRPDGPPLGLAIPDDTTTLSSITLTFSPPQVTHNQSLPFHFSPKSKNVHRRLYHLCSIPCMIIYLRANVAL